MGAQNTKKSEELFTSRKEVIEELLSRTSFVSKNPTLSLLSYIYGYSGLGKSYLVQAVHKELYTSSIYYKYYGSDDITFLEGFAYAIIQNKAFSSLKWKKMTAIAKDYDIYYNFKADFRWKDSIPEYLINSSMAVLGAACPNLAIPATILQSVSTGAGTLQNHLAKISNNAISLLDRRAFFNSILDAFIQDFNTFLAENTLESPITIILDIEGEKESCIKNKIPEFIKRLVNSFAGIHWIITGRDVKNVSLIDDIESRIASIQQNKVFALENISQEEIAEYFCSQYGIPEEYAKKLAITSKGIPYYAAILAESYKRNSHLKETDLENTSNDFFNYVLNTFNESQKECLFKLAFLGCWNDNKIDFEGYSAIKQTSIVRPTIDNYIIMDASIRTLIFENMDAYQIGTYVKHSAKYWNSIFADKSCSPLDYNIPFVLEMLYSVWQKNASTICNTDFIDLIYTLIYYLKSISAYYEIFKYTDLYTENLKTSNDVLFNAMFLLEADASRILGEWDKAFEIDTALSMKALDETEKYAIKLCLLHDCLGRHKVSENMVECKKLFLEIKSKYPKDSTLSSMASEVYSKYLFDLRNFKEAASVANENLNLRRDLYEANQNPIYRDNYLAALSNATIYNSKIPGTTDHIVTQKELLNVMKQLYGNSHPNTLTAKLNYFTYLADNGNYKMAITNIEDLIKQITELDDKYNTSTLFRAKINRINFIANNGDYERAINEGKPLLSEIKTEFGRESEFAANLEADISYYYMHLEQYAKAARYAKRATKARKKVLGQNHPLTLDIEDVMANAIFANGFSNFLGLNPETGNDRLKCCGKNIMEIVEASNKYKNNVFSNDTKLVEEGKEAMLEGIKICKDVCNRMEKYNFEPTRTQNAKAGLQKMELIFAQITSIP
ncbi:tetratricopeptide repeat protein [Butyrivibrio sp. LB2008]|uniref:tetratricopeptide repeat protein n=1 Tax=Butyrivibrio sp. LB2008 TaxID=1408305 RepID=UPI00047ACC58|nr:tetratricopeptide repeat protein [Butyrivibrio sp. LB2008]